MKTAPGISKAIQIMGKEPINPLGSCFDSAAHQMIFGENKPDGLTLCHGIGISNMPGDNGNEMAHAWIEWPHPVGRIAYDTTWGVATFAEKYRADLKLSYFVEYSLEEAWELWLAFDYPGPWDNKIAKISDAFSKSEANWQQSQ